MIKKAAFNVTLSVLFGLLLVVSPARFAFAAEFNDVPVKEGILVTKQTDTADGKCDSDCSLREAIIAVNAIPGHDVINLPAGIYTLTRKGSGEDDAASGNLDITDDLTVIGAGAANTIIDGGGLDRVFQIRGVPPACENVDGTQCTFGTGKKLDIHGVTIRNGFADQGGGILMGSNSNLALIQSIVSGNAARNGGGILVGPFSLLNVYQSTISNNKATQSAPGVDPPAGGGIKASNAGVIINYSSVHGNTSDGNSGGIEESSGEGLVLINGTTVARNSAAGNGGGIRVLTGQADIMSSTISENEAATGGGIFVRAGNVSLENSILTGNTVTGELAAQSPDCYGEGSAVVQSANNILGAAIFCGIKAPEELRNPQLTGFVDPGSPGNARFPLLSTSPAIDAGTITIQGEKFPCDLSGGFDKLDQLGQPRSVAGGIPLDGPRVCDIGAVEFFLPVNQLVRERESERVTEFDPTPAPGAPAGTFLIIAKFDNISDTSPPGPLFANKTIFFPFFEVAAIELKRAGAPIEDQPVLLNADRGPGRMGARLTPQGSLTTPFPPGETGTFQFLIGLQKREPFVFFVNMLGEPRSANSSVSLLGNR